MNLRDFYLCIAAVHNLRSLVALANSIQGCLSIKHYQPPVKATIYLMIFCFSSENSKFGVRASGSLPLLLIIYEL